MSARSICICLVSLILLACEAGDHADDRRTIALNQLGFQPDSPKEAFISSPADKEWEFFVIDSQAEDTVHKGKISAGIKNDSATGEDVYKLDFTEVNQPGTYHLWIPESQVRSADVDIGPGVYGEALSTAVKSFYYQRCGTAITNSSMWEHPVCHADDAPFYDHPENRMDAVGGWHDAGDYGKFSVNTAVSLAFLLYLYDHRPDHFGDGNLNIPESGNDVPDLLDEARWALDWLLKMQRDDGAVYHKIQKKKWTGEYLPHEDPDARYVYEVSSTATADFAAVAALGARVYRNFDRDYSADLEQAAEKAWRYLEKHPDMVPSKGFKNPPDVSGGEYGDHEDADERIWAAAELYRLTGKQKYDRYFLDNYRELTVPEAPPLSWKNVSHFAWAAYLRAGGENVDDRAQAELMEFVTKYADNLVQRSSSSGYRVVLQEDEYYWGSNSVILGYAFSLTQAHELTGREQYKNAALDQLHYILGRNPFHISFVTGVGHRAVKEPYHQFSNELGTDQPVPGMLVGGPNSQSHLNGVPLSEYPGKAYEDNSKNYMVNEVAINYTAPLVYLLGYFFEHPLQNQAVSTKETIH